MVIEDELLEFSLKLLKCVGQHPKYFGVRQKLWAIIMVILCVLTAILCVADIHDVVKNYPTLLARKTEGFMTQIHVSMIVIVLCARHYKFILNFFLSD